MLYEQLTFHVQLKVEQLYNLKAWSINKTATMTTPTQYDSIIQLQCLPCPRQMFHFHLPVPLSSQSQL